MMIKLYNTLSRRKETFKPIHRGRVGLYTCGPTVYNYAHIGNLRTYIFEDVLRRTLEFSGSYAGYKVKHVMNITDVGHMISDADDGEDKLEKGARREGKSVWDIAKFYAGTFLDDLVNLNIKKAHKLVPATSEIKEQIKLIRLLFAEGFAYETAQAIYFDVAKFKGYTKLSRQKLSQKLVRARKEVVIDHDKKHPADFVLWFKLVGRFKNHTMRWPSPWSEGFPGWHIECSAISSKYLGQPFDIHTGGVDLIFPHHENEIAQSEAATGKKFVRFWLHGEHLLVNGEKMSKSLGNIFTLRDIEERKFDPIALRYLVLTSHYRSKLNFTWDSLKGAENSLKRLYAFIQKIHGEDFRGPSQIRRFREQFIKAVFNDLDTPRALAVLWGVIHRYNKNPERFNTQDIQKLFFDFDKILGLEFKNSKAKKISAEVIWLIKQREELRSRKEWNAADEIRKKIYSKGFVVEDTEKGPVLKSIKEKGA